MSDQSDDIIICEDVHKWYDNFHALKGISLAIQRGEVVVIFGPSGSGKSTFIRTINRLEEHQRGRIVVDGIELTHDIRNIEAVRSEIGMVFQSFNLFPHLTVMQNITLAQVWVRRRKRKDAEEKALQLLTRVGIPEQAHKYPGQLSGGQQQRIFLARSLAQESDIYFLDEPFVGVDAKTEKAIFNLMKELKDNGKTILVVHHDLGKVLEYFDKLILINQTLIAYGKTKDVFTPDMINKTYGGRLTILQRTEELING